MGEQGRGGEQQRKLGDKGRNLGGMKWFGSSPMEAAVEGGEGLPGLGLHVHTGPPRAGHSWVSALPKYFWDYYCYYFEMKGGENESAGVQQRRCFVISHAGHSRDLELLNKSQQYQQQIPGGAFTNDDRCRY